MLSVGFSRWLAASSFQNRALPVRSGIVIYRLADRSGCVAIPIDEWDALGRQFEARTKPVLRMAHVAMGALLPVIMVVGLAPSMLGVRDGIVTQFVALAILLGLFFGPVAIYLWQSHRVRRIAKEIEAQLARGRRVPTPEAGQAGPPRWLQIALTLLVGPTLLLQIYGTLNPQAYHGTRWSGLSLDWVGLAGLAAVACYYGLRWRANRADAAWMRELERRGRSVDFLSRARADTSGAARST